MALIPISSLLPAAPAAPATPAAGAGASSSGGKGFGNLLANEVGKLDASQQVATNAAQQVATGQATDISTVAMQVEEASLSLQLAVQVRDKLVNAYDQLYQMNV